jgi:uncharacterized protein HemX
MLLGKRAHREPMSPATQAAITKSTPVALGLVAALLGAVAGLAMSYGVNKAHAETTAETVTKLEVRVDTVEKEHATGREQYAKDITEVRGKLETLSELQKAESRNLERLLGHWGIEPARAVVTP